MSLDLPIPGRYPRRGTGPNFSTVVLISPNAGSVSFVGVRSSAGFAGAAGVVPPGASGAGGVAPPGVIGVGGVAPPGVIGVGGVAAPGVFGAVAEPVGAGVVAGVFAGPPDDDPSASAFHAAGMSFDS